VTSHRDRPAVAFAEAGVDGSSVVELARLRSVRPPQDRGPFSANQVVEPDDRSELRPQPAAEQL